LGGLIGSAGYSECRIPDRRGIPARMEWLGPSVEHFVTHVQGWEGTEDCHARSRPHRNARRRPYRGTGAGVPGSPPGVVAQRGVLAGADRHMAEQLAEVGVILLMFGVGLHFHLKDLIAVRGIALAGALVQSTVATGLGALVFHSLGWNWSQGIVFGLALSVASTVVLVRVLSDNGELQGPAGRIAVGWLVVEDIFTVFVLVLLPVLFSTPGGNGSHSLPIAVGIAAIKLAVFIVFTLVVIQESRDARRAHLLAAGERTL
jgi:predicted Kef-type K+ transport protein